MNIGLSLQAAGSLFHPCNNVLVFLELKVGGTKLKKIVIACLSKRVKDQKI